MGSRLGWFPGQGAFTSRILGSAAARTWDGHLGQVPGVVYILSEDVWHHSAYFFSLSPKAWMKRNMAAGLVLPHGKFHQDMAT